MPSTDGMDPVALSKLAELREKFIAALPDQVRRYEDALARRDLEQVRMIAHRLAGGAGLHGFMELSRWGKRTERLCVTGADAEGLAQAGGAFAELVAAITARR